MRRSYRRPDSQRVYGDVEASLRHVIEAVALHIGSLRASLSRYLKSSPIIAGAVEFFVPPV